MNYGGLFDQEGKENRIKELETITLEADFWNRNDSNQIYKELNSLKNCLKTISDLKQTIKSSLETFAASTIPLTASSSTKKFCPKLLSALI